MQETVTANDLFYWPPGHNVRVEEDADIVMFLDRSLNEKEAEQDDRPPLGTADVIVAKHRNGPIGDVHLAFQSNCTRFDNIAPDWDAQRAQSQGY